MNWKEYIKYFSNIDSFSEMNISISFDGSDIIEPSFFTRLNHYFVENINEMVSNNKIVLIVPKHSRFIASFAIYKELVSIKDNLINCIPINLEIGQKLKLYDSVVELTKITKDSQGQTFVTVQPNGKRGTPSTWPIDKLPPFKVVPDNTKLTGDTTFYEAKKRWQLESKIGFLPNIKINKGNRDSGLVVVGPVNKYKKLFKSARINNEPLLDYFAIGYMDNKGTVKPLSDYAEHYDLIICPDSFGAFTIFNESDAGNVYSVLFDLSDNNCSSDYVFYSNALEKFKNVSLIYCIRENYTFDLSYFMDNGYSIFQWKKNYITDDFVFDKDNPSTLVLGSFKERQFHVYIFDDEVIKKSYDVLNSYKDVKNDLEPSIFNAYYQFSLELLNNCRNYCFLSNDFLIERRKVLKTKLDQTAELKTNNSARNHPLIKQLVDMENDILDFYSKTNKKIDFITNYLLNNNEKVCIVIPDNRFFDPDVIYDFYKNRIFGHVEKYNFSVLSLTSYKESDLDYHTAIFVGWNHKTLMKEALFSNNAYKNIILLYEIEKPWLLCVSSEWNISSYKNDFSLLDSTINPPADELFFDPQVIGGEKESSEDNKSFDDVKKELDNSLAKNKMNSSPYGKNTFVEAAIVTFSDDTYGVFERYKSFVTINGVLKGDEDKPVEKNTEDLKPGDIVIFKDKAIDLVDELAKEILEKENNSDCDIQARLWKSTIDTVMSLENLSVQEMVDAIIKSGSKRHPSTIKSWINSNAIICPIYKEDLICIAIACGTIGEELLDEIDDIYNAASVVRGAHIKAGFEITERILNTEIIKKDIVEKYNSYGFFDFSRKEFEDDKLGHLTIVKVTSIGDFQEYPLSICNLREDE